MKKSSFLLAFLLLVCCGLSAQVSINTDNSPPENTAMLDVKSNTKGMLIPRMTQAEILAVSNPANGLQVFCTTDSKLYIYLGSLGQWKEVAYGTGTLLPPFSCGIPVTINHTAGTVAPVTKTVTYGTVANIPGEPSKCWITSNLGADHQATTVNDATEPSAGWYWQFNQKQGYKHDGSTRTPNTNWVSSISENTNWVTTNDPCNIELGTTWRIPTYSEWFNVDYAGGWTNWNGPWNSGLKLHTAGGLYYSDGSLVNRGSYGFFWSNTQSDATYGWSLYFSNWGSYMGNDVGKAFGFSLRCVCDN